MDTWSDTMHVPIVFLEPTVAARAGYRSFISDLKESKVSSCSRHQVLAQMITFRLVPDINPVLRRTAGKIHDDNVRFTLAI